MKNENKTLEQADREFKVKWEILKEILEFGKMLEVKESTRSLNGAELMIREWYKRLREFDN